MQTATTNTVAKIAAVVAGLGLVAMSFASFAPAAKAQTMTTTTTTTATFSRDLTIGSTGADVTALQNWLIAKGFSIPAGATGYFGAQTTAAVAAYQAANGITPAAGYFGPITRAKVNAGGSVTTPGGSTTTPDSGDLEGDEADLSDFNLIGEETSGDEGEEEVQIATAQFDVEDGDISVQRLEITLDPQNDAREQKPSDYFDNISVWADGEKLGDVDTDNRNDWDENGSGNSRTYTITITGLDYVVRDGDTAEITIAGDIADGIDTADLEQDFKVYVEERGIRAVDAAGIQQYIGDDSDKVTFGFGAEESGDITLRESSDNPDADTLIIDEEDESDDFVVLAFEFDNDDDADALLTDLTINVATSSTGTGNGLSDIIRTATLTVGGDDFRGDINDDGTITFEDMDASIAGDDTTEGSLSVTFNGTDVIGGSETVSFSFDDEDVEAEGEDNGDESEVDGTVQGETFSLVSEGIAVTNGETTSDSHVTISDSGSEQGDYSVTFDVEAVGETVYLPRSADNATTSQTAGFVYNVIQGSTASTTVSGVLTDNVTAKKSDNGDTSGYYVVRKGSTRTFTLQVTYDPIVTDFYAVELTEINFNNDGSGFDENYVVPDNSEFQTDAEQLNG